MCQYSAAGKDGMPTEWHYVHYVSRAAGGTGLLIIEMTDVEPDGRITDYCLGLWSDEHIPAYARIIAEVKKFGAKTAIQIAHAGRKAQDTDSPVAPSPIPVDENWKTPRELTTSEVKKMVRKFADASRRAVEAGVDTIELHGAHGYLIHQFHSPSLNKRSDEYGQDLALFGVEVVRAVKEVMPPDMPLIMRISAIEYIDGGYELEHAIKMARRYKEAGVDVFDISTGGEGTPGTRKPQNTPGFQVPYAKAVKNALKVPVIAVGMLEDPWLAAQTLENGDADLIGVARGMLTNPYWAYTAIRQTTGQKENILPRQYTRGL
jgi:2,4-dienoyl-CoA reductase-like NADH-dependent reductase (Old Yellow Enzyme family)